MINQNHCYLHLVILDKCLHYLIILRIAIFEIKYSDVASKIAVNEAVELAKEFSYDKSYKFINAILQNLI